MNDFTVVPCFKCICVPVCRHKPFHGVYLDCAIIREYFQAMNDNNLTYSWVESILEPTRWKTDPNERTKVIVTDGKVRYGSTVL